MAEERFQEPPAIKDLAGLTVEEQEVAVAAFLSHADDLDTPVLISISRKLLQILESRGLGEDLPLGGTDESTR